MAGFTDTRWSNRENAYCYEIASVETYQEFAEKGGLSSYSDLSQVDHYILQATSILEIGACYGRVIDYLFQSRFVGKITAIERSKQFFHFLQSKYSSLPIRLIHADAATFQWDQSFDLILWMWSGISDFTPQEQLHVLGHLFSCLLPGGFLILDTFSPTDQPLNAETSQDRSYTIRIKDRLLYGYIPSIEEMKQYAEMLGFQSIQVIPYSTHTHRPRLLYVLAKPRKQ